VATDGRSPEDVARATESLVIGRFAGCQGASYALSFGPTISNIEFRAAADPETWRDTTGPVTLVCDATVSELHSNHVKTALEASGIQASTCVIAPGESNKSLDTWASVLSHLHRTSSDREQTVIALGGGVVCDLAGFAASAYLRGVNLTLVPTTLLAQVDAAIGGKTGVDFEGQKNMVGSFYPADRIIVDRDLLRTLPNDEQRQGMAEIIKVALVRDSEFVIDLQRDDQLDTGILIRRAIRNKLELVASDPFEKTGARALLNFGHTIGHAVEALSGFTLRHGDAVAIGMMAEVRIALALSITHQSTLDAVQTLLEKYDLPMELPPVSVDDLMEAMHHDKKVAGGTIRMIMLTGIGTAELRSVDDLTMRTQLARLPGVRA
jgi:3-dehydroquinate synthase